MNRLRVFILPILLLVFVVECPVVDAKKTTQKPSVSRKVNGETWLDTQGRPIQAHGGGILFYKGTYYWYGEVKAGKTWLVEGLNWECYRTDAGGVSCYSSKNLKDWKYEGVVLSPNSTDTKHDLHLSGVLERPKVVYNKKTRQFVMWLHVDHQDYSYARAGVAVGNSPIGPFNYLGSCRPNNAMSRDMTLFKDDDERAYLVFSSENNATMHVCMLTDDYLKPSPKSKRIFINKYREAPAVFKYQNRYYMITSGCTGWSPNKALLAVSDSMLGDWKLLYNPCIGEESETTFGTQSTFVLPVDATKGNFLFMADRWNKTNLPESKYVWLPLFVGPDSVNIPWKQTFEPNRDFKLHGI